MSAEYHAALVKVRGMYTACEYLFASKKHARSGRVFLSCCLDAAEKTDNEKQHNCTKRCDDEAVDIKA